jgi:hypothetical protein
MKAKIETILLFGFNKDSEEIISSLFSKLNAFSKIFQ